MTLPSMASESFYDLLLANGYTVLQSTHWETEGITRVILGKGGHNFTYKIGKRAIPAWEVINKVNSLGLTEVPEKCREEYDQCMGAEKYRSFTAYQFKELVKGNKFRVEGEENYYFFSADGSLLLNDKKVSTYDFRIVNGKMCLITDPQICKSDELIVEFNEDTSTMTLHLSTMEEKKMFAVLLEHPQEA